MKFISTSFLIVFGILFISPNFAECSLTEEEQRIFKSSDYGEEGEQTSYTEKEALTYLPILLKGDPNTIRLYKNLSPSERREEYQEDLSDAVNVLGRNRNRQGYDLIIQVLEKKAEYTDALSSAINALQYYGKVKNGKWYGERKSIPYLKEFVNHKEYNIRHDAAASLLSAGDGDTALPILDEIAKGGNVSGLYDLFALEEKMGKDGRKYPIRSKNKLYDKRAIDIFKKAIHYENNEVKLKAASSLIKFGDKALGESVMLDVLKKLKDKRLKNYGLTKEEYRRGGKPGKEKQYIVYMSDGRALENLVSYIRTFKIKKAVPYLRDVVRNPESSYVGDNAAEVIRELEGK